MTDGSSALRSALATLSAGTIERRVAIAGTIHRLALPAFGWETLDGLATAEGRPLEQLLQSIAEAGAACPVQDAVELFLVAFYRSKADQQGMPLRPTQGWMSPS